MHQVEDALQLGILLINKSDEVRQLALQYPKSGMNTGPLLIYLTARDRSRGEQALQDINNDSQLLKAKALRKDGGLTDVQYRQLDISDQDSIVAFEKFLKDEHPDGIDILINNAGIAQEGFDANVVDRTLATNYHATMHITQSLLPHIKQDGRLVNVSSMACKLTTSKYSPAIIDRFKSASTIPEITTLMDNYAAAVKAGTYKQDGWSDVAYSVSKSGLTGATNLLGKQMLKNGKGPLVNCCCPGYVNTDMTKHRGRKTPDQGAQTPVMLALGDLKGNGW